MFYERNIEEEVDRDHKEETATLKGKNGTEGKRSTSILSKLGKLMDKVETIGKFGGVVIAIVTLWLAYQSYKEAQKRKTAEFTSATFKAFSENRSVKLVNELLDYNARSISLANDNTTTIITDDVLFSSLIIDTLNGDFSDIETKIRDVFDEYFDQLSLFNRYAKANLISYREIKPYLDYQASIIADTSNPRKRNELRYRIWDYINYYGFADVKELYREIGYNVK